MKLQDFISETLTEIIQGVKNAQEFASKNGAMVNPTSQRLVGTHSNALWDDDNQILGQQIEFDITVTTRDEGQTEGKAGVFVTFLKAGIAGKEETENIATNKIKFSIPIFLPIQKDTNE